MQCIYKKISFYLNYISNLYNISKFFIKTIIVSFVLSRCSILSEEKKIFFNKLIINKSNEINTQLKKQNNNIDDRFLKNYKEIIHESKFFQNLSKNVFINKIIYIKKNSNFFRSAHESGLHINDINTIIKAMEWQVNFRKLNVNSTLNLIFLKKNNFKKNKNILLGIKLNNLGKIYYAIRALDGNFYNLNGFNKSKIIMNFSLLKKYRVTSNFNLHRFHPITHQVSRHLGIDLAMPQGTIVLATSAGKITKTSFNKISGFYIILNHGNKCITKYMHLKKILVKVGQNIKINQKIALSGNTGRTTGAHLHYEIWINKRAVNPIYAESNFIEQLTQKEKVLYFKTSKIILSKFK